MDFLELAKERYSCRKLSDVPVEKEKIDKILEASLAAPTAVNNQPYKIWVLESEDAQKKIAEVTRYTFGAKVFILLGARQDEAWIRPFDGKNYAEVDGAIVATHIMLSIHELGLGSTWVGYFNAPRLKEIYPEMADYELIALFPLGYPAEDSVPSPRHTQKKNRELTVKYL